MGRHAAGFWVFIALLAGACSSDGSSSAPATTLDPSVDVDAFGCPVIDAPVPALLEVGVVSEHPDNGSDHEACASGYDTAVPTSGTHFSFWQNCGFYTEPVRDYAAVHALEHGAVWIAYDPDLTSDEVAAIEAAAERESHILAAPYPGLQNPIVMSAWTRQLAVDKWADPLVDEFLGEFLGRLSSTAPEAGVQCDGGFGTTPDRPDADYAGALELARGN